MPEINIPPDAERIEEFAFVKVFFHDLWRPALLVAWIRTPDGWACQLRTPSYRAARGRVTHTRTMLFDPALVQLITVGDLNPPSTTAQS